MSSETNVSTIPLTLEGVLALDEFINAKEAEKVAVAARKAADEKLRAVLGDAVVGTVNGIPAVKVVGSQNSRLNKSELQDKHPEIYNEFLVVTPYNYLKVL